MKTIEELKQMPIWLLWRKKKRNDGISKIPFTANGKACGANDANKNAWVTYEEARQAAAKRKVDGVGFVIPRGMFFLDIDHRDLNDPRVQEILDLFNSYSEFSVNGSGIHIYGLCDVAQLPTSDGKLRQITNDAACTFVLWVGSKRLIKRRGLDAYLENAYSI